MSIDLHFKHDQKKIYLYPLLRWYFNEFFFIYMTWTFLATDERILCYRQWFCELNDPNIIRNESQVPTIWITAPWVLKRYFCGTHSSHLHNQILLWSPAWEPHSTWDCHMLPQLLSQLQFDYIFLKTTW